MATGHYKTADKLAKLHRRMSLGSALLSAVVGTTVFATLQSQPSKHIQIAVGLVSLSSAVLAAVSSVLGYQEKAEKHRLAVAKYNSIGRRLELMLAGPAIDAGELRAVRDELAALAEEMPHIPRDVHDDMGSFDDIDRWGSKLPKPGR